MKVKAGYVLRKVMDDYMLMPSGESADAFKGCVLLNRVSAFIWERLQTPVTRGTLLAAVLENFAVDEATAAADLDRFLRQLQENHLLEEAADD